MCCEKRLAVWQGDGAWNERVKVQQKCLTTPSTKYKSATETKMTYVHTQCNYLCARNNQKEKCAQFEGLYCTSEELTVVISLGRGRKSCSKTHTELLRGGGGMGRVK